MHWGSDELHHRSAERSGWCAELRAAHPEDVDETVTGAVEYAAGTTSRPADADVVDADSTDARDPADSADAADGMADTNDPADADATTAASDEADPADDPDGYVCALCGADIPDGEALDGDGAPVDVGFRWLEDVDAYHRSCIEAGDGRFLPWAANGVLNDETTR